MLENFPQAFSHVALINTAVNLSMPGGTIADAKSPAWRSPATHRDVELT
jgi:hypothetical protein